MEFWLQKFSDNLQKYRLQKRLTKTALATLVDCDVSYIGKIERREKSPNFKMIIKLATALEIEPKNLFE